MAYVISFIIISKNSQNFKLYFVQFFIIILLNIIILYYNIILEAGIYKNSYKNSKLNIK
jgi:hypothetical protein